jgi:hypothetical protein
MPNNRCNCRQRELYTSCQAANQIPSPRALGSGSGRKKPEGSAGSSSRRDGTWLLLNRSRRKAESRYFSTGPRHSGGEAAEIGDLLDPVGGIATGAGFDVTLGAPPALIARTT